MWIALLLPLLVLPALLAFARFEQMMLRAGPREPGVAHRVVRESVRAG